MLQNLSEKVDDNEDSINNNTNLIANLTNKDSNNNVHLKNYPVGSIYVSTVSTNPGDLFGGTWIQLKDRFLLGAGDTYAAGTTGGEATHTLTTNEMPSHRHGLKLWGGNIDSTGHSGILPWGSSTTFAPTTLGSSVSSFQNYNGSMYNTGGSQPHNNMPPYLTVYMWKRTA